MWVIWNLASFHLETVLVSMQDRCHQVTRLKWKLVSVHLEIVLIFMQDRCMVCVERTIRMKIILDALDGTPR